MAYLRAKLLQTDGGLCHPAPASPLAPNALARSLFSAGNYPLRRYYGSIRQALAFSGRDGIIARDGRPSFGGTASRLLPSTTDVVPAAVDALEGLLKARGGRSRRRTSSAGGAHARILVRYLVLLVIDLKTQRVHIAGVTCAADGGLEGATHTQPRIPLHAAGVQLLRLPANSPNLNAYAGRFVRSIEHERLRHILPLGERYLSAVVHEFVERYHAERNHQGMGNVVPFPSRFGLAHRPHRPTRKTRRHVLLLRANVA
jgi:hypothetical protein